MIVVIMVVIMMVVVVVTCPSPPGIKLDPKTFRGNVMFSAVDFAYPTRPEAAIFRGLDLMVPAGE